ncbi:MAG: heparinase II/III family protein [Kiritimatiellae bacterium]|nr:heparinase II/III family protein [Kiritimatiellia bacterium]
MRPHPRLYLAQDTPERLARDPRLPFLRQAARQVARDAARYAKLPPLRYPRGVHNELLIRAREMQTRVVTLLARWSRTGDARCRAAVLRCVEQIGGWEYWSWIAWRAGRSKPDAIFDLSYGENSATLGIAYDWLHAGLSRAERALFLRVARRHALRAGLKHAKPGGAWWFGRPDSNWNSVCAGGLGMLALALYEDAPEAPELLKRAEQSIAPFVRHLDSTAGGWPEGIGYWNYGMRYAFMYLLSHENSTGRPHPLLRVRGLRRTLRFPFDFCPHGQPCSFGDVNHWSPLPVHYAMAVRLGDTDVCGQLDAHLQANGIRAHGWPDAAEWLALHPGRRVPLRKARAARAARAEPYAALYTGLDWAVLADRMPQPRLYMSIRGGTTRVPHSHRDLMSFHCLVGSERLVVNLGPAEYLDTTFSARRYELPEMMPMWKNTLLINGVGVTDGAALDCTELVRHGRARGVRLVATTAMGASRDRVAATFCGRLILLLDNHAFLVVDRVRLPHTGRCESRLHTFAEVRPARDGALLRGERAKLRVAYACTVEAGLYTATTAPTTPSAPAATMLRWCTGSRQYTDITMATLLAPGVGPAKLALKQANGRITISLRRRGRRRRITLTDRLQPVKRSGSREPAAAGRRSDL